MHRKLFHRHILLGLVLGLLPAMAAPAPDAPRTALESDPEGWTDLLAAAGPALEGWNRLPLPAGGKLSPESQWSLDPETGHLVCKGDGGHEWLRWGEVYGDFIYHVEWRFTPIPGGKGYNSGVYARNSPDGAIYHQAQTGDGAGGYLFGNTLVAGAPKRFTLAKQSGENRVKPAGEWNTYEITCRGKEMILRVNGEETSLWRDCEVPKGHVGLEAEGFRIEFRNLKVKPLKAGQ